MYADFCYLGALTQIWILNILTGSDLCDFVFCQEFPNECDMWSLLCFNLYSLMQSLQQELMSLLYSVSEPPPSAALCNVLFAECSAHPQMHRINLQPRAHIQEVGNSPVLQHNVDSHSAPWRSIQQVLEDLQVCQEVHDDGHHLETQRRRLSFSPTGAFI